jgi:hypothetical protein
VERGGDGKDRAGKRMRVEEILAPNHTFGDKRTEEADTEDQTATGSTLGRIYVKGGRSRYLGVGDRMAMLDHVSIWCCGFLSCEADLYSLRTRETIS